MKEYSIDVYINGNFVETQKVYGYCEDDVIRELDDIYRPTLDTLNYMITEGPKKDTATWANNLLKRTGLNRAQFCKKYNVPYGTFEKWQYGTRECPRYVKELFERVVKIDFK